MATQGVTHRAYKELHALASTKWNMRLNIMDKTIANPKWKSTLIIKDEALEETLRIQIFILSNDRIHRANIDKNLLTLNTKVDTTLTPLLDTFEYQHIIQKFDDQYVTDEQAAKYCSKQRSQIVVDQ